MPTDKATRSAVVLFRDPARGDSYKAALQEDHDVIENIAVLEHQNLLTCSDISNIVNEHLFGKGFAAMIFTSQNAVHALNKAVNLWVNEKATSHGEMLNCDDIKEYRWARWKKLLNIPVFVVGRATGAACLFQLFEGRSRNSCDIRGENTGKASALLSEILEFCNASSFLENKRPKLLFFCGDQRRDTLPKGIAESNKAELVEMISYTTVSRDQQKVKDELLGAIDRITTKMHSVGCASDSSQPLVNCSSSSSTQDQTVATIWMVLFSPSGARVVAPILDEILEQGIFVQDAPNTKYRVVFRMAAIGHTTASELVKLGIDEQSIVKANVPNEHGIRNALACW
ncbi:tetrapyrrole biosynthesis, uroporphyrinogen III synthase [Coemansia reversa NRRL 1564]|uniref:Tetrapyrrole biosynthesis, uroporphyrinogen III synthase n=1 Tax=Coemansia reversa (strain ATCC 12441 / NRRL 1564) TaxID=763665 RepID=A0A2G5B3S9_COERN|nr:tetrapyrrole biosynthesis, uroporphyrinogen III synthase [Coemansia reversa NRRL 1564]|eukprot:PIA13672.1 tetrapyrrole biosynthesis, uroporphyrinogen III synthase [Coemansia reversa NRRL 1564]